MPSVDLVVATDIDETPRVKQLCGMFDVPARDKLTLSWQGQLPLEEKPWHVGLIVGPSGVGKSSIARALFGKEKIPAWKRKSVIDDFDAKLSIQQITDACSAVGFNTIPSWMKPYAVLSTGERFRVDLARRILSSADPIVVDEFTSVVDRQVAHIAALAVAKYVRKHERRFVAATCHYDVIPWLQPDWILEPATMGFKWVTPRRRPHIAVEIARVDHAAWQLFAPFHYLSHELHRGAACYVLFANGEPAVFCGVLHRPHPTAQNIRGVSRIVTLPDYQGLGLAFVMLDTLASHYTQLGYRFRNYPAHPPFIRAHDRSDKWALTKMPGVFSPVMGRTSTLAGMKSSHFTKEKGRWNMGGRPCAVFEYVGKASGDAAGARKLIEGYQRSRQKKGSGNAAPLSLDHAVM